MQGLLAGDVSRAGLHRPARAGLLGVPVLARRLSRRGPGDGGVSVAPETAGGASAMEPARPDAEVRRDRRRRRRRRFNATPYLFVLPALLAYTLFAFAPLAHTAWLSLYEWDGLTVGTFVGLDNYRDLLQRRARSARPSCTRSCWCMFYAAHPHGPRPDGGGLPGPLRPARHDRVPDGDLPAAGDRHRRHRGRVEVDLPRRRADLVGAARRRAGQPRARRGLARRARTWRSSPSGSSAPGS